MSFTVNNDIVARESNTAAKGVRLYARQDVEQGRRVVCQVPILKFDSLEEAKRRVQATLNGMPSYAQALFIRLPSRPGQHVAVSDLTTPYRNGPPSEELLQNIMEYNAVTLPDAGCTIGVASALVNHSCVPNAYLSYNKDTRTLDFHMLRDVKKDREITVSYFQDLYALTEKQRNERLRKWRFCCTCPACASFAPMSNTRPSPSDTRREKMKSLFSEMDQFTIARLENSYDSRPDPRGGANIGNQEVYVILDSLKEIIRLMKEEGLYGLAMSQLLEEYAPLHDETGTHEARRSQMTEAWRIRQMCLGSFHPSTLELQRKLDRLQYLR